MNYFPPTTVTAILVPIRGATELVTVQTFPHLPEERRVILLNEQNAEDIEDVVCAVNSYVQGSAFNILCNREPTGQYRHYNEYTSNFRRGMSGNFYNRFPDAPVSAYSMILDSARVFTDDEWEWNVFFLGADCGDPEGLRLAECLQESKNMVLENGTPLLGEFLLVKSKYLEICGMGSEEFMDSKVEELTDDLKVECIKAIEERYVLGRLRCADSLAF